MSGPARRWLAVSTGALALLAGGLALPAEEPAPVTMKVPAPEFTGVEEWINSKPLDWKALRGKVVVVHFWAFG